MAYTSTVEQPFGTRIHNGAPSASTLLTRPACAAVGMPCRHFHARYVDISPSVHCPHIGPTGGGKCTEDLPYSMSKIAHLMPNRPTFYSVNPLLQAEINQTAKW